MDNYSNLDASALAELIANGETTASELLEAAISRAGACNDDINAIIIPQYQEARDAAAGALPEGPFRGVPFLTKDLGPALAGEQTYSGMQLMKDQNVLAPVDTFLALRFRDAGLVNFGRTNTPELGLCPTTEPVCYGPTCNPWDLTRSPGGSSGGSAAAIASRIVPVAHGNDGGGSLRIPASACGIVGLKPSRGRISSGPLFGEAWHGLATEGVMGWSIRDIAAFMDLMSGFVPGDPYTALPFATPCADQIQTPPGPLRIGFMAERPWQSGPLHADCKAAVEHAAQLLSSLGHQVSEDAPSAYQDISGIHNLFTIVETHTHATLDLIGSQLGKTITQDQVEPYTWYCAERGRQISASEYLHAVDDLHLWSRSMAEFWSDFDLLLTPTLGEPPVELGDLAGSHPDPARTRARNYDFIPFTPAQNATGDPAISLPLYWNDADLPIGVQLVALHGQEGLLLQVAKQLEDAAPWRDKVPPTVQP
jgi:amidase